MSGVKLLRLSFDRFWLFAVSMILYGAFCSPMPREVSVIQLFVGVLIIFFIGIGSFSAIAFGGRFFQGVDDREEFFLWLIFFSITILCSLSSISVRDANDVIRDIVPHGFIFMPLFGAHAVSRLSDDKLAVVYLSFVVAAFLLMIRYFSLIGGGVADLGSGHFGFDQFLHLSADPVVLFSAIYCSGMLAKSWAEKNILNWKNGLYLFTVLLAFFSFSAKLSRGPFALLAGSILVFFFIAWTRASNKVLYAAVLLLFSILMVGLSEQVQDNIYGVFSLLIEKQLEHGDSGKTDEFKAAVLQASSGFDKALIGSGWGGVLDNPFRYGASFTFTHNIVSYYLVKGGFLAALLMIIYIAIIYFGYCKKLVSSRFETVLAAALTFSYCAMLQPTFKALSLGLILMLLRAEYLRLRRNSLQSDPVSGVGK